MVFGSCPDCGTDIPVGMEPVPGQQVACMNCQAVLQVASVDPVILTWSDEDYFDFDEFDENGFEDEEDEYEEGWRRERRQKARQER